MTDASPDPLAGLPPEVAEVLRKAPVRDKMLAELALGWAGLAGAEARMAAALRVFVVTWDPLEHQAPRPAAAATVNAGPPGLEIVVYLPVWWVMESAAARQVRVAEVVGELAGSAVVVAADDEEAVTEGRYPSLLRGGSVPALLGERAAGAALGTPELCLVSEGWEPIGLGAIADVVQDALGPVDLDRAPVELAATSDPVEDCPACAGRRFGFPGELGEATSALCPPHRAEAERLSTKRYERAHASNPDGWGAILDACCRLELPHLPNGLATRLAGAEEVLFEAPEPEELTAQARAVVAAAGWFPGRPEDLAVALGAEEDMAWLPEWLSNLVFDLGYAGLGAEAAEVGDALARVDPDNAPTYASDVAFALANGGDEEGARARVRAILGRWPQDLWVRIHAGDALSVLGDADGAETHFLAALDMAEEDDDFEARSDICERLERLGRAPASMTTVRLVGPTPGRGRARRTRPGRNDPCFCGSGRKYKHCHGARS